MLNRSGWAQHPLRTQTRTAKFRFYIYKVHFTGHEADEAPVDAGAKQRFRSHASATVWGEQ